MLSCKAVVRRALLFRKFCNSVSHFFAFAELKKEPVYNSKFSIVYQKINKKVDFSRKPNIADMLVHNSERSYTAWQKTDETFDHQLYLKKTTC